MTTAARPTWSPAKGGTQIFGPSQKYSSRDRAAHTTLKSRREGQDTQEEVQKRNLREELEERERRHFSSKDKSYNDDRDRRKGNHLLLEGSRTDTGDCIVPCHVDADDSDVKSKVMIRASTMNPLLNNQASFSGKRRWDDDVVFKNQARGDTKILSALLMMQSGMTFPTEIHEVTSQIQWDLEVTK
ncbi:hypothetical protein UlMin_004024 [Ulmus minor]